MRWLYGDTDRDGEAKKVYLIEQRSRRLFDVNPRTLDGLVASCLHDRGSGESGLGRLGSIGGACRVVVERHRMTAGHCMQLVVSSNQPATLGI